MKEMSFEQIKATYAKYSRLFNETCALLGNYGVEWMSDVHSSSFLPKRKIATVITLKTLKEWGINVPFDLSDYTLNCPETDEDEITDDLMDELYACGELMDDLRSNFFSYFGWEMHSYDIGDLAMELSPDSEHFTEAVKEFLSPDNSMYANEVCSVIESYLDYGVLVDYYDIYRNPKVGKAYGIAKSNRKYWDLFSSLLVDVAQLSERVPGYYLKECVSDSGYSFSHYYFSCPETGEEVSNSLFRPHCLIYMALLDTLCDRILEESTSQNKEVA